LDIGGSLSIARYQLAGAGTQTAGLGFGGLTTGAVQSQKNTQNQFMQLQLVRGRRVMLWGRRELV
jgi:hypothetical protein